MCRNDVSLQVPVQCSTGVRVNYFFGVEGKVVNGWCKPKTPICSTSIRQIVHASRPQVLVVFVVAGNGWNQCILVLLWQVSP
jgi:hypothetical protein